MSIVLLILFTFTLILLLPLGIAWAIYRWLHKRVSLRAARYFLVLPSTLLLLLAYFVYTAFYPTDDFYEQEYVRVTSLPVPASVRVVAKDASYPDQHGDYAACARFEVSSEEYESVLLSVSADRHFTSTNFQSDSSFIGSESFSIATKGIHPADYYRTFSKGVVQENAYQFIGFLKDHRTVIVYRCSS
ncbi:hypothetical protein DNI29_18590 [Hymenobacter sediminis]|uniref:hypothetical protein n=1 Tax=Hymenobacter sediminis TaxID=2218621 RepID=UPI000DA6B816|nr:hypothetical protein [Hymenobacter sediminis]RPD45391.1 hypothetical protein DNI29_18590 [Hymenobacter sediminis]